MYILEQEFLNHKDYIQTILTFLSILLGILGWLLGSWKSRILQRKQLSISILHDNRYESVWVDATHKIFKLIKNPDFDKDDWKEIAKKAHTHTIEIDEKSELIWADLRTVLNTMEFIAMSINCKAIDEYVIKESWSFYYKTLYVHLEGYINESRKLCKDENIYINFTCLTLKWHPQLKGHKGEPSKTTLQI